MAGSVAVARLRGLGGMADPAGSQQGVPLTTAAGAACEATHQQGELQPMQGIEGGNGGKGPDFVLCIGDDSSDEDMFTSIETMRASPQMMSSEVGQREHKVCEVVRPSLLPFQDVGGSG